MDRLKFLQNETCCLREACARAKGLKVNDSITENLNVLIRKPTHVGLSSDGGDYSIWAHLTRVLSYIYEIKGDWSCDFASFPEGFFGGDYIVLTPDEMEGMMCLPAENQEEEEAK